MRRALVLCVLFAGCRQPAQPNTAVGCGGPAPEDPLAAISVADAQLERMTLWQVGIGYGHVEGDADLVVHDDAGDDHTFAARLDGTQVGLVVDASVDATFNAPFPLNVPDGANVRQLLGKYEGAHVGLDVGVGGNWRDLKNTSDVALNVTTLSFGVGATPATWETLDLELWNDPL